MRFLITIIATLLFTGSSFAKNEEFSYSGDLDPSDYMFGSYGKRADPVFDKYRTINLDIDLGVSADCGRMDFGATVRGALKNILDSKYLGSMGQDIIAASPLLATCYLSPTWCSILKHSRASADMLASLRLNQCAVIDKYVDSRTEEFMQERQACVRDAIQRSGGNFEQAMSSGEIDKCKNYMEFDLKNWAGKKFGDKSSENRLLASSAKWGEYEGEGAENTLSLVQALVGDTIVKKGQVSVDFGPRKVQITPRTHLMALEKESYDYICTDLVKRVIEAGGKEAIINEVVSDDDLSKVNGENSEHLIDRQTLLSIAYLPPRKRDMACRKLADGIAMTRFSNDMNESIDFLVSKVETNPNVPENRKQEASRKRKALKDQVEMALALYHTRNKPLNEVLQQINEDGMRYQEEYSQQKSLAEQAVQSSNSVQSAIFDCADGIFCAP